MLTEKDIFIPRTLRGKFYGKIKDGKFVLCRKRLKKRRRNKNRRKNQ